MNNNLVVKTIPFMGTDLMAARDEDVVVWVGVRWVCDGIGLSRGQRDRQIANIKNDAILSASASNMRLNGTGYGTREVLCLKLDFIPLWLAKINITPSMKAETPEVAERLLEYQLKAKDVLAAAFIKQERKPYQPSEYEVKQLAVDEAKIWERLADKYKDEPRYSQILDAYVTKAITGNFVLPLPESQEKTYSAKEIGEMLGITSNMVGRIAKEYNLKVERYGKWFHDKSRYSSKEVQTFRYYKNVVDVIRAILEATGEPQEVVE